MIKKRDMACFLVSFRHADREVLLLELLLTVL